MSPLSIAANVANVSCNDTGQLNAKWDGIQQTLQADVASDGKVKGDKGVSDLLWDEAEIWVSRISGDVEQCLDECFGKEYNPIWLVCADDLFQICFLYCLLD